MSATGTGAGTEDADERRVRARSFGAVSEAYERYRPGPVPAVLDWLLPAQAHAVADVGAGTGALTRLLVAHGVGSVTAVEPDGRMGAVLADRVPGAVVLEGTGESIPLPDGSQDAVLASSSWHWVDPVAGAHEVARVLRPGGRFGVLWSGVDRTSPEWFAELWGRIRPGRSGRPLGGRQLDLPVGAPFGPVEGPHVEQAVRHFTRDDLFGLAGTYSGMAALPEDERATRLAEVRAALEAAPQLDGGIDLPVVTRCWRTERQ